MTNRSTRIAFCLLCFLVMSESVSGITLADDQLVNRPINFTWVVKTLDSPILDGHLNDTCWQKATELPSFVLTAGKPGETASQQTKCYLLYDDTHLYVAFQCIESDIGSIKAGSKLWDDRDIFYDDRVVVYLDINHDHRSFYELAVNPIGVQFDQSEFYRLHGSRTCDMDPSWNCFWRAKTSIGDGEWITEIAIDVTSFGLDCISEGETWGVNFTRVRLPGVKKGDDLWDHKPGENTEYSAWTLVKDGLMETISNFHAPLEFGDMVFGDPGFKVNKLSLRSPKFDYGPLGFPTLFGYNPLEIQVETVTRKNGLLKLSVEPPTADMWESTETIKLSDKKIRVKYWIPEMLENKIIIQILDPETQKQLYRTSYIEIAHPFIEFDLEPLYTRNPETINRVRYRMLTNIESLEGLILHLDFKEMKTDKLIVADVIEDLSTGDQFTPIFDIMQLRDLPGGEYCIDCKLVNKTDGNLRAHFQQNLTKFDKELPKQFSTVNGDYSFGGITDHAVQILFPFSAKFVFWRKASYIPWWEVEQVAMSNEFVERWGFNNQGCCEPMQDRECRYSNVRIIENSSARVVVHWRYALSDAQYKIYQNEWVDEYYVLYPDGAGTREVNLWPNSSTRHEILEILLVKPPGVQAEQLFDEEVATLSNLEGESYTNKYLAEMDKDFWKKLFEEGRSTVSKSKDSSSSDKHQDKNKNFYDEFIGKSKGIIFKILYKDRMRPFTVFSLREDLLPNVTADMYHVFVCRYLAATADRRGHWPASRYQIDGFNTVGLDVPHHGNLGSMRTEIDPKIQPMRWKFLIGIADKGSDKPIQCARSWLYPGKLEMLNKDLLFKGYDHSQRAYIIRAQKSQKQFKMKFLAEKEDVTNPVFLIDNPDKTIEQVRIDDEPVSELTYKIGKSKDNQIVLFLERKLENLQIIEIDFK